LKKIFTAEFIEKKLTKLFIVEFIEKTFNKKFLLLNSLKNEKKEEVKNLTIFQENPTRSFVGF
jgi:hypothetical protein